MDWKPIFYADEKGTEPVKDFILTQSDGAIAEILHVLKLLRAFNVALEMPYSRKINKSLRELRILHGSDYYRILYCAVPDRQFLLLHGVKKKTARLSPQDIKIGESRLDKYLSLEK